MLNLKSKLVRVQQHLANLDKTDYSLVNADIYRDERDKFLKECFDGGGRSFVDAVKYYGRTEKGLPIDSTVESYIEFLELIGDFRLNQVYTTGCAQVGKTLGHFLLKIFCLSHGRCNTGWFYDRETTLEQNVPIMWRPISKYWITAIEQKNNKKFNRKDDKTTNACYQLEQVTGIFGYVSTGRKMGHGQAAAGSATVGFQIDIAFLEERSQYEPGAADPVKRRLDASSIPTKPIRELGTPGGGQGIELEMKQADRYFYPHYFCPDCNDWFPLDPLGCLLRKVTRIDTNQNKPVETFFSESGRPLKWFCDDELEPVNTAYIGCSNCGAKLSDEQRYKSKYKCIKTGEFLRYFLDNLPKGLPQVNYKSSIHLSPLVRQKPNNVIASEIIFEGLKVIRTDDWQQQMLGWASQTTACHVTPEMLNHAMTAPRPNGRPDMTLSGIDVGRSEDWMVIIDFYYPENYHKLSIAEIIEKTIRVVKFGGGVNRSEIIDKLDLFNVRFGIIDNEPSMESSINLCRESDILELGNQIGGQRQTAKQTSVIDGGQEYPCWNIRNEKFLQSVLEGFLLRADDGYSLYRLPGTWEQWKGRSNDERSPLLHLSAPWRDNNNKWHRGKDNIDDLYYAFLFCEVAFYLQLTEGDDNNFRKGNYKA